LSVAAADPRRKTAILAVFAVGLNGCAEWSARSLSGFTSSLAACHRRSPDQLGQAEVRAYLVKLRDREPRAAASKPTRAKRRTLLDASMAGL
jgi:hypothetical protein